MYTQVYFTSLLNGKSSDIKIPSEHEYHPNPLRFTRSRYNPIPHNGGESYMKITEYCELIRADGVCVGLGGKVTNV